MGLPAANGWPAAHFFIPGSTLFFQPNPLLFSVISKQPTKIVPTVAAVDWLFFQPGNQKAEFPQIAYP